MRIKIKSQGFTLIELLVAVAITGIVITLTGSGLYAIMNANFVFIRKNLLFY